MSSNNKPCFQFTEKGTCSYGSKCKYLHVLSTEASAPAPVQPKKKGRKRKAKPTPTSTDTQTPIDTFFAGYPDFDYDQSAPSISAEFRRMCRFYRWSTLDPSRSAAHEAFKDALVQQFNNIYGTDVNDLGSWKNLCQVLHIDPIPDELVSCREVVKSKHVNIVDLVDVDRMGEPVHIFPTEEELSEYTINEKKYFPKDNAYADSGAA